MKLRIVTLTLALAWMVWMGFPLSNARAERYLSVAEAQQVCFGEADRFVLKEISLSEEQSKSLERELRQKVPRKPIRCSLALQGSKLLGVLVLDQVIGKHELIDYAVALSPEGSVLQVEVLEYRENYGSQIRDSKWRDQFKGKTAGTEMKLHEDIYNISGATISCRHVTEGVKRVVATFAAGLRPRLAEQLQHAKAQ